VIDVQVPKMGMQTVEVDIDAVYVQPGDHVDPDSVVVDVASEKTTFSVVAGVAGVVKEVLVSEGMEVKVGDVVIRITPLEEAQ
jgi:pyruvate/2-oxoglutarate dehydrogenase complex dihydrolipoamide acyltransferase (E2) component